MIHSTLTKRCKACLRSLAALAFIALAAMPGNAQTDNADKLSASTHIFMQQLNRHNTGLLSADGLADNRVVAKPDTVNGQVYMSAFVRLTDPAAVGELESLGVVVQERFLDGKLLTTLIPVDRIRAVADIARVSHVNAATKMRLDTHQSRKETKAEDILTLSAAAAGAGLKTPYDGTGVVIAVLDDGIDFGHIAFKDVNGKSRIKRAYVYDGKEAYEYTDLDNVCPSTDNPAMDHGTHTASTAGGSSVIVSGSSVTVTDDHARATYGGMAPGATLYLAGVNGLADTYLSNAVSRAVAFADELGWPIVVSNSWGGHLTPHDGTGDVADVYNSLFGDDHPGRVALFSAANDAGKPINNEWGGFHVSGVASPQKPLCAIIRSTDPSDDNGDPGYYYNGNITSAWARDVNVTEMSCKIHVLSMEDKNVVKTIEVTPSKQGTVVNGLEDYYSGTLAVYKNVIASKKAQVLLAANKLKSTSAKEVTLENGSTYLKSDYTLAVELAPVEGETLIDAWGCADYYFTIYLNSDGYDWKCGDDDMTASDESTIANVISVGAYVASNTWTNYAGAACDKKQEFPDLGDIAYFSSYATAENSPTGLAYPWITAPGTCVVAGVNHYHTTDVDDKSYYGSKYNNELVVNSSTSPYAVMDGTSMSTPVTAGIVALWMQAAREKGIALTVNDVKKVMQHTAVTDSWTTGTNSTHFGNGKIDALAGIAYILAGMDKSGIDTPRVSDTTATEVARYNVQGQRVDTDYRGIVIVRLSDGTVQKIMAR